MRALLLFSAAKLSVILRCLRVSVRDVCSEGTGSVVPSRATPLSFDDAGNGPLLASELVAMCDKRLRALPTNDTPYGVWGDGYDMITVVALAGTSFSLLLSITTLPSLSVLVVEVWRCRDFKLAGVDSSDCTATLSALTVSLSALAMWEWLGSVKLSNDIGTLSAPAALVTSVWQCCGSDILAALSFTHTVTLPTPAESVLSV